MTGRARLVRTGLAVLATFLAAWPVTPLVEGGSWVVRGGLAVLAVALTGVAARAIRLPDPLVLPVQLLGAWWALMAVFAPGSLSAGLPLAPAGREASTLVREGLATIRAEAVPATESDGLSFVLALCLAVLSWSVDALAVTLRAPALAGLPLLLVLVGTAAGSPEPPPAAHFLVVGGGWLLLLVQPRVAARRRHGITVGSSTGWAAVLGTGAVVLAVLLAGVIPHQPTHELLRGPGGDGGGATVRFTETLDLAVDLGDRSSEPVLSYRVEEGGAGPLRVLASHRYAEGQWWPMEDGDGPQPPDEVVEREDVARVEREVTVVENKIPAPQLALPYPATGLDLGTVGFERDERSGTVRVEQAPRSYEVTATEPTGSLPRDVGRGRMHGLEEELLRVDGPSRGLVTEALGEVLREAHGSRDARSLNQLEVARAIQAHLRGPEFTYSLELAAPLDGEQTERGISTDPEEDPLSHFLLTRTGYCTHFATAMVMMARAADIPARIAMGFLPGEIQSDGSYTVVAADAHAWPELYITGLGWTAFEPTPGERAGAAPAYPLRPPEPGMPEPDGQDRTAAGESPAREESEEAGTPQDEETDEAAASGPGAADGAAGGTLVVVTLSAAGLLSLLLVLLAGRRCRWAVVRAASSEFARVDGAWTLLLRSLGDLGVSVSVDATPRRTAEQLAERLDAPAEVTAALDALAGRVAAVRYAPGAPEEGSGEAALVEASIILGHARRAVPRRRRLMALLWPRSGRRAVAPDRWRQEKTGPGQRDGAGRDADGSRSRNRTTAPTGS